VSIGTEEEILELSPLLYPVDADVFPISRRKAQLGLPRVWEEWDVVALIGAVTFRTFLSDV
jgi:hypothetical protein